MAIAADLAGPAYKFELSSTVPSVGLVRIIMDMNAMIAVHQILSIIKCGSLLACYELTITSCWKDI